MSAVARNMLDDIADLERRIGELKENPFAALNDDERQVLSRSLMTSVEESCRRTIRLSRLTPDSADAERASIESQVAANLLAKLRTVEKNTGGHDA